MLLRFTEKKIFKRCLKWRLIRLGARGAATYDIWLVQRRWQLQAFLDAQNVYIRKARLKNHRNRQEISVKKDREGARLEVNAPRSSYATR
jgi:hypothetical protein